MSDKHLNARIADELANSQDPDPRAVAAIIRYSLTASESNDLIMGALVDRVRSEIHQQRERARRASLPRGPRGKIAWPEREKLVEIVGDGSFGEAAMKLGVGKDTLKRHCESQGITDVYGRITEKYESALHARIATATTEFAEGVRAEGIRIGLAQANAERVCIAGRWTFLADCTAEDLRTLAREYEERASDNVKQCAYYLAVAQQVEAGGYATVRAMLLDSDDEAVAA